MDQSINVKVRRCSQKYDIGQMKFGSQKKTGKGIAIKGYGSYLKAENVLHLLPLVRTTSQNAKGVDPNQNEKHSWYERGYRGTRRPNRDWYGARFPEGTFSTYRKETASAEEGGGSGKSR